jgi:hypothetical protein
MMAIMPITIEIRESLSFARQRSVTMPLPIQVPDDTVVLSNRFGNRPFED